MGVTFSAPATNAQLYNQLSSPVSTSGDARNTGPTPATRDCRQWRQLTSKSSIAVRYRGRATSC